MAESRRLRTDAERAAEAWRQTAASRPGFVTYPGTAAGDPSWWRRGGPVLPPGPVRLDGVGPPPVDGETCKQWCGYCHLPPEPLPVSFAFQLVERHGQPMRDELERARARYGAEITAPRRRWWHRFTRRTPR